MGVSDGQDLGANLSLHVGLAGKRCPLFTYYILFSFTLFSLFSFLFSLQTMLLVCSWQHSSINQRNILQSINGTFILLLLYISFP